MLDSIPTSDNVTWKNTGFSDEKRMGRDLSNCKYIVKILVSLLSTSYRKGNSGFLDNY